jgi:hypothetical protein
MIFSEHCILPNTAFFLAMHARIETEFKANANRQPPFWPRMHELKPNLKPKANRLFSHEFTN